MDNAFQSPRWILRLHDLPSARTDCTYKVNGGQTVTFAKRERQVIDALRAGPTFCASTVRLGSAVGLIRERLGGNFIQTLPDASGRKFYALGVSLEPIQGDSQC